MTKQYILQLEIIIDLPFGFVLINNIICIHYATYEIILHNIWLQYQAKDGVMCCVFFFGICCLLFVTCCLLCIPHI